MWPATTIERLTISDFMKEDALSVHMVLRCHFSAAMSTGNRDVYAVERFLDPATREVLRAWIEKDVYICLLKAKAKRRARASASLQFGPLAGFSFNVAMKHFGL